jgi:hypothetical protein
MKKYISILILLTFFFTHGFSQKYKSGIYAGSKIYIFNDWGFDVLGFCLNINYTYQLKSKFSLEADLDLYGGRFNTRVLSRPFGPIVSSRYITSGGIALKKEVLKRLCLNAGARLKHGIETTVWCDNSNFNCDLEGQRTYAMGIQLGTSYEVRLSSRFVLKSELGYQRYFSDRLVKSHYYGGLQLGYLFQPIRKKKRAKSS